jgi:hypothetical protein
VPPPTPGAALAAAALGQTLPESATQEARRKPELPQEDIVPARAPEADKPKTP